jgi:hypothetical protein
MAESQLRKKFWNGKRDSNSRPQARNGGGRSRASFWTCAGACSLLSSIAAHDQPRAESQPLPASQPQPQAETTITVDAARQQDLLKRQINTFVKSITMPTRDEALMRWHSPVCPAVAGLPRDKGEFVLQRLSHVAQDATVPLGPQDCAPNLLVLFSKNPQVLLENLWEHNPRLFNDDRGIGGAKRFLNSMQAIRAWYNADLDCYVAYFRTAGGMYRPSHCSGSMSSKLSWEVIRVISSAIVVVDLRHVGDVTLQQQADYVAMLAFAQIRENAHPGSVPTVLRLFSDDGGKPDALTPWDAAFLKALYSTNSSDVMQVSEMQKLLYAELGTRETTTMP